MIEPDYDEGDRGEITLADWKRDANRFRNELIKAEAKIMDLENKLRSMTYCESMWRRKAKEWYAQLQKAKGKSCGKPLTPAIPTPNPHS